MDLELKPLLPKRDEPFVVGGVVLVFLFPALGGLLFGFDVGTTAFVVSKISGEETSEGFRTVCAMSASVLGAFVGSMLAFALADPLGRRRELMLGAVLYGLGASVILLRCLFDEATGLAFALVIMGRMVYGVGEAFALHGMSSYCSEMSPPSLRGTLTSGREVFIVSGILLGNGMGFLLRDVENGWMRIYVIQVCLATIMSFGTYTLPPSARWLALQGHSDGVAKSLEFIYPAEAAERTKQDILTQLKRPAGKATSSTGFVGDMIQLLGNMDYRPQLICGLGIIALQQITGEPTVLWYIGFIFRDAGIGDWADMLVGLIKVVLTLASVVFVDRVGRKKLLYVGIAVQVVSLFVVALAFVNYDGATSVGYQKVVIVVFLLTYIAGYQIGFGPVGWAVLSEVFPLEVRGQSLAFAGMLSAFLNLLSTSLFEIEVNAIGDPLTFAIFGVISVYSLYFVYDRVVETKGLSLEQVTERFAKSFNKVGARITV